MNWGESHVRLCPELTEAENKENASAKQAYGASLGQGENLQAPSFNCKKASSKIEKMICSNTGLSQLDSRLAQAYKKALAQSATPNVIKEAQKKWLAKTRNICTNVDCLSKAYQIRIGELDVN